MPSFLVLGHGVESTVNFEARATIPPGITLVTIAECGVITTAADVCPMVEAFTNPDYSDILSDPRRNKAALRMVLGGKDIHMYTSGQRYPALSLQMFLDWSHDTVTQLFKSGVYQFPAKTDDLFLSPEKKTFCERLYQDVGAYKGFSKSLPADMNLEGMFKGSIFPTVDQVVAKSGEVKQRAERLKDALTFPLERVFEKGGPGVYYYVVCRSPKGVKTPENLVEAGLVAKSRYEPFFTENWISRIPTILPLLEENKGAQRPTTWTYGELEDAIRNYTELQKVPRTRRMSVAQQASAAAGAPQGGRRRRGQNRTRTQRRTLRKTRKHRSV